MIRGFFPLILGSLITISPTQARDLDGVLDRIIEAYALSACEKPATTELAALGEHLFSSKELSGARDISCSTCHIEDAGFADGLPMAIGVGGVGEGLARLEYGEGAIVARNAFTLIGRGHEKFNTFFWDGKIDIHGEQIFSPFGDQLAEGFDSALAVAAILPLTERDEFLGEIGVLSENDLQREVGDALYQTRFGKLDEALRQRLKDSTAVTASLNQAGYRASDVNLVLIGNALAQFIRRDFSCTTSPWEEFLSGEATALTEQQKEGAVLFFGKARCASCHTPPLFSDFRYYNLGVPQGSFGPHSRARDLGRAGVTNEASDRYQFRTPPLLKVSETAPYGHNGIFKDLRSVIRHHANPVSSIINGSLILSTKDELSYGKILALMSDKMSYIEITEESEISALEQFLLAL
jgi:cytochrome c peroxidase